MSQIKKGAVGLEATLWLWRLIPVFILAVFFYIVVLFYRGESFNTTYLDQELVIRNLFTKECLGQENARSGIIDVQKISDIKLQTCAQKENQWYGIKLRNTQGELVKEASVMPVHIQNLIPVCPSVPEYQCTQKQVYVLYQDQNQQKPGILEVERVQRVE